MLLELAEVKTSRRGPDRIEEWAIDERNHDDKNNDPAPSPGTGDSPVGRQAVCRDMWPSSSAQD